MDVDAARRAEPLARRAGRWLTGRRAPYAIIAVALIYGWITSRFEAPSDGAVFWAGNLAAPYVALPALAGATRSTLLRGAGLGALTGAAMVFGFYGFFGVGDLTYSQMELDFDVTARDAILRAYRTWFETFLLGDPGGRPWLSAALVAGGVAGALGHRWSRHGALAAGVVVALALLLEPLAYVSGASALLEGHRLSLTPGSLVIWAIELAAGVAVALLVWRRAAATRAPASG